MAAKVISLRLSSAVTPFFNLYPKLSAGLDAIAAAFVQGPPACGTAYAASHGAAHDLIAGQAKQLTPVQLGYLSGLGYTQPSTLTSEQADVTNSLLAAWDAAAGDYLHGRSGDGDKAKQALHDRLQQFDAALQTQGKSAVAPDK